MGMSSVDYLTQFVEVNRALCDGADNRSVMNLIAQRLATSLDLKGCLIKIKPTDGGALELLSSYGLTENFLFSDFCKSSQSLCFRIPKETISIREVENMEESADYDTMMIEGIRSATAIPIEVDQKPIAIVVMFDGKVRDFTKEELQFAEALVSRGILSVIYERRINTLIERERNFLHGFQEISSAINSTLTINKVLKLVVTKITDLFKIKGTTVRLLDAKTQNLYLAEACGLSKEFLEKGDVEAAKSIAENMAGKVIVIDDVYTDPRIQYPDEVIKEGIRKILSIPLAARGKIIGVLRLFSEDRPPFTEEEKQFATGIALQCALAIENARMYQRVKYEYQQLLVDFGYEGSSN